MTKINAAGTALVYSSLLGGSGGDFGNGIAIDSSRNAYVTGETSSSDFPIVNQIPGACNGTCGSGNSSDVFVTKINAAGTALVYSSFLGGSGCDAAAFGIAVDSSGSAYLTGGTSSSDFPIVNQIPGACNGTCGTGTTIVAFVAKINAAGTALVYSSLLGGSGSGIFGDMANGIAVDNAGNTYVTGETSSSDFPIVNQIPGACNGSCGTGINAVVFVTRILQVGRRAVGTPAR